ncbi:MAG: glutamate--tRNA ligase family protein, partial [Acholeplasmataceae bacterium]|nr:glutamate--tRNA ligase family protein [Acholeplasmataceae bacterium]
HPLEDAIEGITHTLCSLEFEDHRPLYDWVVRETEMPKIPRQIEFGRLSIENTVMSKRYLRALVESHKVTGWDDPRMPTLQGLRRRGYTPDAIRHFVLSTGLSKVNSTAGTDMLEASLRDDLQTKAKRAMAVINPLKVTITNYEDNKIEYFDVDYNQDNLELGSRKIPFSKHLYIEQDDFVVTKPNNKYKRLSLGEEVRLFHAYFIKANDVIYDKDGNVVEVLATYDVATKSGSGFNERKPNGTIHYVDCSTAVPALFNFFGPMIIGDDSMELSERFNNDSWVIKKGFVEHELKEVKPEDKFQFMRNGYFNVDTDSKDGHLIFNEIVPLKSSYK